MKSNDQTNDRTREMIEGMTLFAKEFFEPAFRLLCDLLQHAHPGVRIYSMLTLVQLLTEHMSVVFGTVETLKAIAGQLSTSMLQDTDPRVRRCAAVQLEKFMSALAEYGAACKAAARQQALRN